MEIDKNNDTQNNINKENKENTENKENEENKENKENTENKENKENKINKENKENKKNSLGSPIDNKTSFNTTYCSNWNNNDFYSSSYMKFKVKAKDACPKKKCQSSGKGYKNRNKNQDNLENGNPDNKDILSRTIEENNKLEKNDDELENLNKLNNNSITINDNQNPNNITSNKDDQANINVSNDNIINNNQINNDEVKNNQKITDNNNINENTNNFYYEAQDCNKDICNCDNTIENKKESDKKIKCYESNYTNNKGNNIFFDSNAIDYKLNSLRLNPEVIREVKTNSSFPINISESYADNVLKNVKKDQFELINTDIIRSIESINENKLLIATLKNLSIYNINYDNHELTKECDIKEFNYRINYATELANGHLIVCSYNMMNIIELKNDFVLSLFRKYNLIQKLNGRKESGNINKVIEVVDKKYLISCDEAYIIVWQKNSETNYYENYQNIKLDSEVKCICYINNNKFVALLPSDEYLIFYDIEDSNCIRIISNIQSSYGRYAICYIDKYKCIFVTGRQGIYLISIINYQLVRFFRIKEWITSIDYDLNNNHLLCGTWKKNSGNNQKNYNFVVFQVITEGENGEYKPNNEDNEKNEKISEKISLKELFRKNEAHLHDIVVIKSDKNYNDIVITGSNDLSIKLWK